MTERKKGSSGDPRLIEDFLPIQAINTAAAREDKARDGHIKMLHLWRARRPLVTVRAAVYAAVVPAARFIPPNGSGNKAKSLGRANASKFIERLCTYPGTPAALSEAEEHILAAHAERLTAERGKPVSVEDIRLGREPRPRILDMFAGGGAIPLEALRLGCEAYALDLNPVAHIIELCTVVYPQRYGKSSPNSKGTAKDGTWAGLSEEVSHWAKWLMDFAAPHLSWAYPPLKQRNEDRLKDQTDLWKNDDAGRSLVPLAYLWTRTVRCKKATCAADVPLVKQTWLRKKKGRFVAVRVVAHKGEKRVRFERVESPTAEGLGFDPGAGSEGGNATCPFCLTVADSEYVQAEGRERRVGRQLMAVVAVREGTKGKIYFAADELAMPEPEPLKIQREIDDVCTRVGISPPTEKINPTRPSPNARGLSAVTRHGLVEFVDLFAPRQLLCMLTLVESIRTATLKMQQFGYSNEHARAIATSLALAADKMADYSNTATRWGNDDEGITNAFSRQALPMVWDFAEAYPWSGVTGSWPWAIRHVVDVYAREGQTQGPRPDAMVARGTATRLPWPGEHQFDAIVTDPPYYDNVPYADISDFFYVWLRRTVGHLYPEHFSSELTPKKAEATALSSRHGGDMTKAKAEYEAMMLDAFRQGVRPDPMRKDQINRTVTARRAAARRRSAAGGRRVVACEH